MAGQGHGNWKRGADRADKRTFDGKAGEVQLSAVQVEFLEWLVDPATSAEKGTQKEWAESHGLTEQTPSRWKKDMAFRRQWDRRLHDLNISPDRIQRVIDTVYDTAINAGNHADRIKGATLYLQFVQRLSPGKTAPVEDAETPLEELSDEELAALASNVLELRAKKA